MLLTGPKIGELPKGKGDVFFGGWHGSNCSCRKLNLSLRLVSPRARPQNRLSPRDFFTVADRGSLCSTLRWAQPKKTHEVLQVPGGYIWGHLDLSLRYHVITSPPLDGLKLNAKGALCMQGQLTFAPGVLEELLDSGSELSWMCCVQLLWHWALQYS